MNVCCVCHTLVPLNWTDASTQTLVWVLVQASSNMYLVHRASCAIGGLMLWIEKVYPMSMVISALQITPALCFFCSSAIQIMLLHQQRSTAVVLVKGQLVVFVANSSSSALVCTVSNKTNNVVVRLN